MGAELKELLGELYTEDSGPDLSLGSFCLAPVFYPHPTINVVRPLSNDPAHPDNKKYQIVPLHPAEVGKEGTSVAGNRFPDKTLNLSLGEDLFVVPGKRRPVAILFNPHAKLEVVVKDGGKTEREIQPCFGCAPSYSLTDQAGNPAPQGGIYGELQSLEIRSVLLLSAPFRIQGSRIFPSYGSNLLDSAQPSLSTKGQANKEWSGLCPRMA